MNKRYIRKNLDRSTEKLKKKKKVENIERDKSESSGTVKRSKIQIISVLEKEDRESGRSNILKQCSRIS